MSVTPAPTRPIRPFAVIGWSVVDEVTCPDCLRTAVPVTAAQDRRDAPSHAPGRDDRPLW